MITELITYFTVLPKHCNHHLPMVFGGEFMAQMDIAAAMLVSKTLADSETATYAVTHKFSCEFSKAAQMGDIIELQCKIVELREKAIIVEVKAMRSKRGSKVSDQVASAKAVFVAKNGEDYVKHGLRLI